MDGVFGEAFFVGEPGGVGFIHLKGGDVPLKSFELEGVEAAWVAGDGVAEAAAFEEFGGGGEVLEDGVGGEFGAVATGEADFDGAVVGLHLEIDAGAVVLDGECGVMMFAGEDAAAGELVEFGAGVAARDENAFALGAVGIGPLDGDAVSGVFAGEAKEVGNAVGTDVFESNEADADDGVTFVEFGCEARRQESLNGCGIGAEIDEDSAFDGARERWQAHKGTVTHSNSRKNFIVTA